MSSLHLHLLLGAISLFTFVSLSCEGHSIHDKLRYHEFLKVSDTVARSRTRRSVDGIDLFSLKSEPMTKEFHFKAYNMTFSCKLSPRKDLYSAGFKLTVYDKDGVPRDVPFKRDQVFVGSCDGDPNSEIRGTFKGDVFSGILVYDGVRFGIEDAKRHIPSATVDEELLVYKASDIKWNEENGHFCGNTDADPEPRESYSYKDNIVVDNFVATDHTNEHRRHKRATTPNLSTCKILLVADYKFYRSIGGSDIYDTALHMSSVMDRVDAIYRATQFTVGGKSYTGLGFEIGAMRIHESYTTTPSYNRDQGTWVAATLLSEFSNNADFADYCVAHLFTYQAFEGNTLGLAYIASSSVNDLGGMCSPQSGGLVQNTGWTTYQDAFQQRVLEAQSDLVTAHELGHNWGSQHDPTGDCAPSSFFGDGKYLMYAVSVSGADPNNNQFSSCSRTSISAVLLSKGIKDGCFEAKSAEDDLVCGNGRIDVDNNEDCDAGFLGRFDLDPCCDSTCKFKGTATCSPFNWACCENCQTASSIKQCREENSFDCFKGATCNGQDLTCPTATNKDDGSECLDSGSCVSGVCTGFCEYRGETSCACAATEDVCKRCCQDADGNCRPYGNGNLTLRDGTFCPSGYCQDAVCQIQRTGSVAMLFDLINNLSVDYLVKFFKQNLVGCVLVFSLILWIPGAWLFTWIDRQKRKRLNRSENIPIRANRELVFDQDGRKVVATINKTGPFPTTSPRYRNLNFTDLGGFGSEADA